MSGQAVETEVVSFDWTEEYPIYSLGPPAPLGTHMARQNIALPADLVGRYRALIEEWRSVQGLLGQYEEIVRKQAGR